MFQRAAIADLKSSLQNEQFATVSMQAKIESLREELQTALELDRQRSANISSQSDEVHTLSVFILFVTVSHPQTLLTSVDKIRQTN